MTSAARNLPGEGSPAEGAPGGVIRFPAISLRTDRAAISAFQEATSQPVGDFVPLTFPFCWLSLPAIRSAIVQMIGADGVLPVHEAQRFDYERALEPDSDYELTVEAKRSEAPPRLVLQGVVLTSRGEACVRFETILRIVSLSSSPAP